MKKHQIISALLALVMLLAIAGCAGESGQSSSSPGAQTSATPAPQDNSTTTPEEDSKDQYGFPLADGGVHLDMWMSFSDDVLARIDSSFEQNYAWTKLRELSGVDLEIIAVSSTTATEKFNLLIVSDDYPDIMRMSNTSYPGGGDKSIIDGVFIDLVDYVDEYAPNYQRIRNSDPEIYKTTITDEGRMYQLQMIFDTRQAVIFGPMIRQDWLEDLGLDSPKTVADWENMLTQMKDNIPTASNGPLMFGNSGFSGNTNYNWDFLAASAWGVSASGSDISFILKDGEIKFGMFEPEMRDYLEAMNRWYSQGLIDQDFVSNGTTNQKQLITDNKVGAGQMIFTLGAEYWYDAGGEEGMYWSLAEYPVLEEGKKPLHGFLRDQSPPDTGMAVSTQCENKEIAIRLMDYFYSDEGALLANYGIEGETFDYNSDGKPVLRDLITRNPDGLSMTAAQSLYLVHSGAMLFMLGREEDTLYPGALEYKNKWYIEFERQLPTSLSYTEEESNTIAQYLSDILTYCMEGACQFIMGIRSFDEYGAYVGQINNMGIDKVLEVKTAAYERYQNR